MKKIAIHQPGYIPWLTFFKKMIDVDIFVFLDDVQYEKNVFQNRNKIRTSDGSMWLTVPVHAKLDINLNEIKIDNTFKWNDKHKKSLFINYTKSRYFNDIWKSIESIYDKHFELLFDLNIEFIHFIRKKLKITTKTMFSSDLQITETGSDRILSICKKLNAEVYISGPGLPGKHYLRIEDFKKNDIEIQYQKFEYPIYEQCYKPFIPNLSSLDLLFNEGKNSKKFLHSNENADYSISN